MFELGELNQEEMEYYNKYSAQYDFTNFKKYLTEREYEILCKFGIMAIEVLTPSGSVRTEGFRQLIWALDYMMKSKNEKDTGSWFYYLASAIYNINKDTNLDKNYFLKRVMMKIANQINKEEIEKQIDFVTLRGTDYQKFCEKYAREWLNDEEVTEEEMKERVVKKQEDEEISKEFETKERERKFGKGQECLF